MEQTVKTYYEVRGPQGRVFYTTMGSTAPQPNRVANAFAKASATPNWPLTVYKITEQMEGTYRG